MLLWCTMDKTAEHLYYVDFAARNPTFQSQVREELCLSFLQAMQEIKEKDLMLHLKKVCLYTINLI